MLDLGPTVEQFREELAEPFLASLRDSGKADSTIRIYRWGIESLASFALTTEKAVINAETLKAWGDHRLEELNPKSRALAATGVRQCFQWALDQRRLDDHLLRSVPNPPFPRKGPSITLGRATVNKLEEFLRDEAKQHPHDLRRKRDTALYFYFKTTAARPSEILQLRRDTFQEQVVQRMRGKSARLVAAPGVARLIRDYLNARTDDNEYLWIGFYGNNFAAPHPLTDEGVLRIWHKLADRAGVPRFTTAQLRNTAGALAIENGHRDKDVAEFLGVVDARALARIKEAVDNRQARIRADLDVPF